MPRPAKANDATTALLVRIGLGATVGGVATINTTVEVSVILTNGVIAHTVVAVTNNMEAVFWQPAPLLLTSSQITLFQTMTL